MRRKDREVTDKIVIEEILAKSEICRIAIQDNGYPYIVPLNYGYCDNALYFHCAKEGKKIDLIRLNNKVGFEIENFSRINKSEQPCKWSMHYLSLIGTGEIEIIEDTADKKKGLDIIMNHYGKTTANEYVESHVNNIVILKLNIKELTAKGNGVREELSN
jgi:nitroimidazol reductase NimA-like FMN-containing flavoprotein (pyridoxamine 5'-phosphate oxidase superfamily)